MRRGHQRHAADQNVSPDTQPGRLWPSPPSARFVARTISIFGIVFAAPAFASIALKFGPPEMFALMWLGLATVGGLTGGSMAKGYAMAAVGVLLAMVGLDSNSGQARFTFGLLQISVASWASWSAACPMPDPPSPHSSRTTSSAESPSSAETPSSAPETSEAWPAPGRRTTRPSTAPSCRPLALGILGSDTTAILLGAFVAFGLQPGPQFLVQQADLAGALIASFFIGNVIPLARNLPLAPPFATLLRAPLSHIYPVVLAVAAVSAFAVQAPVDVPVG